MCLASARSIAGDGAGPRTIRGPSPAPATSRANRSRPRHEARGRGDQGRTIMIRAADPSDAEVVARLLPHPGDRPGHQPGQGMRPVQDRDDLLDQVPEVIAPAEMGQFVEQDRVDMRARRKRGRLPPRAGRRSPAGASPAPSAPAPRRSGPAGSAARCPAGLASSPSAPVQHGSSTPAAVRLSRPTAQSEATSRSESINAPAAYTPTKSHPQSRRGAQDPARTGRDGRESIDSALASTSTGDPATEAAWRRPGSGVVRRPRPGRSRRAPPTPVGMAIRSRGRAERHDRLEQDAASRTAFQSTERISARLRPRRAWIVRARMKQDRDPREHLDGQVHHRFIRRHGAANRSAIMAGLLRRGLPVRRPPVLGSRTRDRLRTRMRAIRRCGRSPRIAPGSGDGPPGVAAPGLAATRRRGGPAAAAAPCVAPSSDSPPPCRGAAARDPGVLT